MVQGLKLSNNKDFTFDIRQTNIAKGVAVLLLLWHHLFYNSEEYYTRFTSVLFLGGIPIECVVAVFCKVCVAIFMVLSGFGLYKSWNKCIVDENTITRVQNLKQQLRFVKNHLLKLMFGFWFVYLIFVPLGVLFDKPFWVIYDHNILYMIIDFLGLANIFSTPTMNVTWWYMGTIIVYYLLFPVLMKLFKYSKELLLLCSMFILVFPIPYNIGELKTWLMPFVFGMYISEYEIFERFNAKLDSSVKRFLCLGIFLIISALIYKQFRWSAFLFAFSIICISCCILSYIPFINRMLETFGKYSAGIFMFHTFIYVLFSGFCLLFRVFTCYLFGNVRIVFGNFSTN